jgi:lipopolysaccharide biosynthesis regulator YciM
MLIPDLSLLAVLVIAVACGFYLGLRQSKRSEAKQRDKHVSTKYFRGLNYLLNEQADNTVDHFIETLEVNSETLETHFALGSMMRRKGEVDRAIKVHQNLVSRPGLGKSDLNLAQLELARDFVKAGLMDRAEGLLQELVETSVSRRITSLELLVDIYRDEREWEKAIHAVNLIVGKRWKKVPSPWGEVQAHFCCELAEIALQGNDYLSARRYLKQGLSYDKGSVRASLLWGGLEIRLKRFPEALKILTRIAQQDTDYLPEAIDHICVCYDAMDDQRGLLQFLLKALDEYPSNSLVGLAAEKIGLVEGEHAATVFMGKQLKARPSIKGLSRLLEIYIGHAEGRAEENLQLLKQLLDRLIDRQSHYLCQRCGFKGNELHWLCPSCKSWGTIKAIRGLEGE